MNAYSNHAGGFIDQGGYTPDNLIAGEFPAVQRIETITGGAAYPRGAVLGRITASGLYVLSDASATDGSQKPAAILAEPIDTTSGDAEAVVYHSGEFNSNALTYGAGHDAASVWNSLRSDGPSAIFLRKPVKVILKSPDQIIDFREAQIHTPTNMMEVRVTDIAKPKAGDEIILDGASYRVQGEPVQDTHHLVWKMEVLQ